MTSERCGICGNQVRRICCDRCSQKGMKPVTTVWDVQEQLVAMTKERDGLARFRDLRTRHNDEMARRTSQLAQVTGERDALVDLLREAVKDCRAYRLEITGGRHPSGQLEALRKRIRDYDKALAIGGDHADDGEASDG